MGDITIQSIIVKAKTAAIKKSIQSDVLDENKKRVKKIKQSISKPKGESVTALKQQLDKELQLVNGIGDLLTDIVEYVDAICDILNKR